MITWTPALINRLKALRLKEEMPFAEIGERLSEEFGFYVPRAACIGKAHRLGLPVISIPRPVKPGPLPPAPPPPPVRKKPLGQYVIYELSNEICRWPIGDNPPLLYCGDNTFETGVPYCRHHAKISYPHRKFE